MIDLKLVQKQPEVLAKALADRQKRKTIGRRRACVPFRRTRGPGLPVPGPRVSRRSGNIGFPAVGRFRRAAERPPARRRGARGLLLHGTAAYIAAVRRGVRPCR